MAAQVVEEVAAVRESRVMLYPELSALFERILRRHYLEQAAQVVAARRDE